ncbi:MAG: sulfatase-like hydrolase/transferase, partial [Deltaproteobacteria bacterium]|nr:sulfatase-like hydrolase/transferase [Deltaproteobacteria bacterium]
HWRYEEDRFAPKTARHTCRWLETNYKTEHFYLHVDFFDPHEPWDPPEYFVAKYANPSYRGIPMIQPNYGLASVFSDQEIQNMKAHYKAEVEMVSKSVGAVIRKMKETGIYEDSLVIFTTDHGIYIGEHNRTGKSNLSFERDPRGTWPLYEEVTRIPLALKMPGQQHKGKRVGALVQPVDILPTILELAGIDPKANLPGKSVLPDRELRDHPGIKYGREQGLNPFHGKSLMPLIEGNEEHWHRKYAFSTHETLLPDSDAMLFWTTITGEQFTLALGGSPEHMPEMYYIEEDPKQQINVYEKNRDIAAEMAKELFQFLKSIRTDKEKIQALKTRLK